MAARALMLQGTGSDVGKSLLVAGLARAFADRGLRVRPFKPQNMSNNAAVTVDGGEIGRAQALQARAARVPAVADMNPVLLKPQSDTGAQVVVQGRVFATAKAAEYHALKPQLMARVLESYARLRADVDLVLVEGAGSPAEINLRAGDIANMGFALAADAPVLLVGDIDRGGVIAAFAGTMAVLPPEERARVAGAIINKFRGDMSMFADGRKAIETHAGIPCLGVVPWFAQARLLPAEDGASLSTRYTPHQGAIRIRVPHLPAIANFDDLDPLAAEPDVELALLEPGEALPGDCDAVLLPGSKATIADLAFLRAQGWDIDIVAHVRRGGAVVGLCGGYQMLGRTIDDPDGIEGRKGKVEGLGLLPVDTVLEAGKTLREVDAVDALGGCRIRGYEIHLGCTTGTAAPFLSLDGTPEGAVSRDGRIAGSYVHGLFASDGMRARWLASLRAGRNGETAFEAQVESTLDLLAAHVAAHLDLDRLLGIAR
ncbi:MAG: cobyric acid synthase [Alphaproteobacteria bacterium]|nr:cobyric acid synthase [Alphaproteobacteria bacterium]